MILFCLPHAGGSEAIYSGWSRYMDPTIKVIPIELKGRGKRFNENFYNNMQEAVDDIFYNIVDELGDDDYAIFGHSMGGFLAYELYYKLNKIDIKQPKHLFFSGCKPPNIAGEKHNIYKLPKDEFIMEIAELGGISAEMLNNREILDIFIPILRNDFRLLGQYKYEEKLGKIECNISILNGNQDSIKLEELLEWNNHCCRQCKIYNFEGNHFFVNDNLRSIFHIIKMELSEY